MQMIRLSNTIQWLAEEIAFSQGTSEPSKQKEEQCGGLIEMQLAYLRVGKGLHGWR